MHNVVYFRWFDAARSAAYSAAVNARTLAEYDIIIAATSAEFLQPILFGQEVELLVKPGKVGKTSFELHFEVRAADSGELYARGGAVQVCYDRAARAKKEIPSALRQRLEAA